MPKGKAKGPGRSSSEPGKVGKLPAKPITDEDARAVKGGAPEKTTEGIKKTMQTQV